MGMKEDIQKNKDTGNGSFWKGVALSLSVVVVLGILYMAIYIPLSNSDDSNGDNELQKVSVSIGDDPVIGDEDAPITLVKFTDFKCPFCKKWYEDTYPQLKEKYVDTGQMKVVYKDNPVDRLHPEAKQAHSVANCVYEKHGNEAYFDYVDSIYSNQEVSFTKSNLRNITDYDVSSCIDKEYSEEINEDIQEGSSAGLRGTPYFVIKKSSEDKGIPLEGAQPPQVFDQLIQSRF